jgi:hypothetical protein
MHAYSLRAGASERWQRLAVGVWVVIAALTCGRALLIALPRHHGIYHVYAAAGQNWRAGQDVYAEKDGFDIFRYSPAVAALLVPFSALPDVLGSFAWRLANLACYVAGLAAWVRHGLPRPLSQRQEALFYLLLAPMSINGLINGQANGLVVGLLLLTAALVCLQRWTWAAACMALATLLKVYPLAFGLLLAAAYPRAFAARLALALGAGLALPFVLQEPGYVLHQYEGWVRLLASDTGRQDWWCLDLWYRDVRFLFKVWLTPLSARTFLALQLGAAVTLAAICVAGRWRGWSTQRLSAWALGMSCCWMLVLGPCTEGCTYILLAPVLAWTVVEVCGGAAPWLYRGLVLLSYGVFVAIMVNTLFPWSKQFQNLAPHPFGGILLFVALMGAAVREVLFPPGPYNDVGVESPRAL